jgi:hypothetical protein
MGDDKLESEIGILLDTMNILRSLKPPTNTNERFVYIVGFFFILYYA